MKLRALPCSVQPFTVSHAIRLSLGVLLLGVIICAPQSGSAQNQEQNKNAAYVHPPQDAPAPKLNQDPRHPAPPPNSAPKSRFRPSAAGAPLPKGPGNDKYKEDT